MKALTKKTRELEDLLEAHKEDTSERENELRENLKKLEREKDSALSRVKELEVSVKESAADSGDIESELAQKKSELIDLRSKHKETQSQVGAYKESEGSNSKHERNGDAKCCEGGITAGTTL